jgi:ribosomal-protein-alanine N-acetyltransferase
VSVLVREYRAQDFDELWRLDQECFPPGIAYSRFQLMAYIRRRGAFTLVAENGDELICGFAVAECHSFPRQDDGTRPNAGHVITIDVHEKVRRAGVGTILMDGVEKRLDQSGCGVVYLETAVNNRSAIAFYKRRGYSVLRIIPRYYEGKLDALLMGKKLRSLQPA